MIILSFAAFAVLKGVHAEKEVAETLGLLALPYGTGVNVGANVLGIGANVGVGVPSVGVNAVPSVGVNAAPSVGVNAAPSVETSAGTVLTTTPTRRGP
ncbi:hypothetical protein PI124_g21678 [Phytophthora idaei]|nr:hypothetical protein PI125_g23397 [Phytophthora idaei]KAG3128383.1 hypothetical protein PI126_g21426 [Phytophthora idaei]KAG3233243.1 hypothetical protein PI124_g21678 [Phytophthora idaei]